jgi:hypothetical protein
MTPKNHPLLSAIFGRGRLERPWILGGVTALLGALGMAVFVHDCLYGSRHALELASRLPILLGPAALCAAHAAWRSRFSWLLMLVPVWFVLVMYANDSFLHPARQFASVACFCVVNGAVIDWSGDRRSSAVARPVSRAARVESGLRAALLSVARGALVIGLSLIAIRG